MEQSAQPSQPLMGVVTSAAQTAYTSPYQPAAMVTGAPAQAAYTSPYQPAAMVTGAPAQAAYTSPYQPAAMVTGAPAQTAYNSPYQPAAMVTEAPAQTAYTSPYQPAAMVTGAPALIGAISPGMQMTSTYPTNPHQLAYQQIQQLHEQQQLQQHQEFQGFWAMQMADIEQTTDFKNHGLPLSRIKKIMKADEDVKMISAEAPMIFAKACEMFILELTLRSWNHTEGNKRRTLQRNDVAAAISETDVFDFLVDIIPRNELKEEGSRVASAASPAAGAQADISVPPQHQVTGAEMIMGNPADQTSTAAM